MNMSALRSALTMLAVPAMLSGCGTLHTRQLIEDIVPAQVADLKQPCTPPTGAKQSDPRAAAQDRIERVKERFHTSERVVADFVLRAFETATRPGEPAQEQIARIPNFTPGNLKGFAEEIHGQFMLDRARIKQRAARDVEKLRELEHVLVGYLGAWVKGHYVDRFGNMLPAPAISRTIGNTEVAGLLSVLIDAVGDYVIPSPVWTVHEDTGDGETLYYPAHFNAQAREKLLIPTGVTVMIGGQPVIPAEPLVGPGECGIDRLKAEAIGYLGQMAAAKASMVGGVSSGSFGGFGVSLGAFGKISVGDNQTVQVVIKTVLGKVAERVAAEAAYRVLFRLPDVPNEQLADLIGKYLDHTTKKD
jgi:hypothetical protein